MSYSLRFSTTAAAQYQQLVAGGGATQVKLKKVCKALALLQHDPMYPGLRSHPYHNFPGLEKEKVWDSYVENNTPGAWRIFWTYGPDEMRDEQQIAIISVVAICAHP